LNLLERVAAVLNGAGMAHALIGAVALAAHGVARSTVDAGGPQDAWDIQQLLAVEDRDGLAAEVEAELRTLPRELSKLWKRITNSGW
jgi:hypothetical protein